MDEQLKETELKAPTDFFGVEYKVGQYFVKPQRRGSSLEMVIGRVVGFAIRTDWSGNKNKLPVVRTIYPGWGWCVYSSGDRWSTTMASMVRRKAVMEKPGRGIIVWCSQIPLKVIQAFGEADI